MSDQVQVSNEFKHNAFALKKKNKCFHNQQSSNVLKESSWKWNKSSKETWQQMDTKVSRILYVLVYMYNHYYRVKNVGILLSYAFCWVLLKEHPYYVHYEPNPF